MLSTPDAWENRSPYIYRRINSPLWWGMAPDAILCVYMMTSDHIRPVDSTWSGRREVFWVTGDDCCHSTMGTDGEIYLLCWVDEWISLLFSLDKCPRLRLTFMKRYDGFKSRLGNMSGAGRTWEASKTIIPAETIPAVIARRHRVLTSIVLIKRSVMKPYIERRTCRQRNNTRAKPSLPVHTGVGGGEGWLLGALYDEG